MADDTRAVLEQYVQALLDGSDFGRFFAPDVVWTTMETGEQVHGRDAVRDLIRNMHSGAFRSKPELVTMLAGGGKAMLEVVFIGTHVGDYAGLPATGIDVRLPYCMAYDVADGAITALRAYFPVAALTEQLSAASRPAAHA